MRIDTTVQEKNITFPRTGKTPKKAIVDRGYRGNDRLGKTEVVMTKRLKRESYYKKRMREARCRCKAGQEGMISHV